MWLCGIAPSISDVIKGYWDFYSYLLFILFFYMKVGTVQLFKPTYLRSIRMVCRNVYLLESVLL